MGANSQCPITGNRKERKDAEKRLNKGGGGEWKKERVANKSKTTRFCKPETAERPPAISVRSFSTASSRWARVDEAKAAANGPLAYEMKEEKK